MKHNEHKDKWVHRNKFSAESQIEIADTYILVLEIERKWLDERVSQLEAEIAEPKRENERLRNYADHTYLCAHNAGERCDCGFETLLKAEEKEDEYATN